MGHDVARIAVLSSDQPAGGCPEGVFASRQTATAVSLKEAKRFVDSNNTAVQNPQAIRRSVLIMRLHKALPLP